VRIKVKILQKREQGFTLIEIVLVLAIAGLILLMVFLAVSGAQRSRRDTQRKEDVSRIASQLEAYASNNQGAYPKTNAELNTAATSLKVAYLTPASDYDDPTTGAAYVLTLTNAQPAALGDVSYDLGFDCNGSAMQAAAANDYALVMDLEQGDACRSNGN
jgi:prepilin-type N-terminal cleavage/methylation domain-containing protein